MTDNATERRRPNISLVVLIAAGAAAVIGVSGPIKRYLATYRDKQTMHGIIDTAHPAIQGPFTILGIDVIDGSSTYSFPKKLVSMSQGSSNSLKEWDTGVWVKVDMPDGAFFQTPDPGVKNPTFTAALVMPDKQRIPLTWKVCSGPVGLVALVDIPPGCPPSVKLADLELKSDTGEYARWRIKPSAGVSGFTAVTASEPPLPSGVSVAGTISLETERWYKPESPRLDFNVRRGQHPIEANNIQVQFENEPPNYVRGNDFHGTNMIYRSDVLTYRSNPFAPFWKYAHRAAITADVAEFETLDETVIFRHVPLKKVNGKFVIAPDKAVSLTTPSGIAVTLLEAAKQSNITSKADQRDDSRHLKTAVIYKVKVETADGQEGLPKSPLTRKYHVPAAPTSSATGAPLNAVNFYSMQSGGVNDPGVKYNFFFPQLPVPQFIDIPVVVTQRVDLGKYHTTVVVPVHTTAGAD